MLPRLELLTKNSLCYKLTNLCLDECMMGMALDTNGKWWVLGVSEKYANEEKNVASRNQTFLNMATGRVVVQVLLILMKVELLLA